MYSNIIGMISCERDFVIFTLTRKKELVINLLKLPM